MHSAIDLLKRSLETKKRNVTANGTTHSNLKDELEAVEFTIQQDLQAIEEMEAALNLLLQVEEEANEG